jgi:hypothetical protein
LEAPLCVFSLGIENQFSVLGCQFSVAALSSTTSSPSVTMAPRDFPDG